VRDREGSVHLPELFCLVQDRGAGVHCLHAKDLVVALLVVEHGRRKVVKDILDGERAMRLYPLVPDEEPVRVVVARVEILVVHDMSTLGPAFDSTPRESWSSLPSNSAYALSTCNSS
jgi:hypothetical protein